jgi:hypothetical protein
MKNKNLAIIATALICAVAIIKLPSGEIRLMFELLMRGGIVLFLAIIIFKYVNKWVSLFLILSFCSLIYPVYLVQSLQEKLLLNNIRLETFIDILLCCLWYFLIVYFVELKNKKYFYYGFCLIAILHVCIMLLQKAGLDPIYLAKDLSGRNKDVIGLMAHPNEASALLIICFPAFLYKKRLWPGIIFIATGIILAKSFLGIACIGVMGLFFVFFINVLWGIWGLLISISGILFYYFKIDVPSWKQRLFLWTAIFQVYKEQWIFGSGLGIYQVITQQMKFINPDVYKKIIALDGKVWWRYLDNEFLQSIFEMGIGAGICFLGYLTDIYMRAKKTSLIELTFLVGIITSSSIHFLFHNPITALIATTQLAFLEKSLRA